MMGTVRACFSWLSDAPRHVVGVRVARASIGLAVVFRVLTEGPFALHLWGPTAISSPERGTGLLFSQLSALFFQSEWTTFIPFVLLGVAGLGLITGRHERVCGIVALLMMYTLGDRNSAIDDGGDNIARLTLFYLSFALDSRKTDRATPLAIWLHNVAIASVATQLMMMYAVSGLTKAQGSYWVDGTALYYISRVEWFSHPAFRALFPNPYVTVIGSHMSVLYQILFPAMIFTRAKMAWLLLGIFFHIGIAISMGLVTFSLVMIGLELFLVTDAEWVSIRQRWHLVKAWGEQQLASRSGRKAGVAVAFGGEAQ
jgi:hypothetical protein